MRNDAKRLRLNREIVRELASPDLANAAGAVNTLLPTFCGCTGTETETNVCCLTTIFGSLPATQCNCTGTESAQTYCVC